MPEVNHTSRKCCFVHRWLIVVGKTRKSKQSEAFRATRGLCVTERIVVLFARYRRQSIKATTRGRRSKSMAQIVGRVRGSSIESISGTRREKGDLARFLSAERIVQPAVTLQSSYNCILWLFILKAICF